jgi:ATP-dependent DNA helicase RecQ
MALTTEDWRSVRTILRIKLELQALRPGQKEALETVLQGQDALAVLPTGSGKSAIYQIAALMIPGPTVVVSPLIALQADQVATIRENALGEATVLNSLLRESERQEVFESLGHDDLEFILLSPEQLANPQTLARLQQAKPSLFVVDEAHCISEWGHSFRPDYLRLGQVIEALGRPVTLALTATASPEVRAEIAQRLGLRDPKIIVTGFDRPNVHLRVRGLTGAGLKQRELLALLSAVNASGIVYVATRKNAEAVAAALVEAGHAAAAYHAGLKRSERMERQEAFMAGTTRIIVATSAFGMGIDKPDVRFVVHYDVPDSLDSYYQEVGRAGRDGEPAWAMLFFSERDLNLKRFFAAGGKLSEADLDVVLQALDSQAALTQVELQQATGLSKSQLERALARLEDQGVIQRELGGSIASKSLSVARISCLRSAAVEAQEGLRQRRHDKLEEMRAYARARSCRRAALLTHFGQESTEPCTGCDNCELGAA